MTLDGKVAIVTGGNSGIGKAITLGLAEHGASIVIDYVADPAATEALEQQVAQLGEKAIGVQADVSKVDDLQMLIDQTVKAFGRLDVMVNNAGVETRTSILDTTEDEYDKVLDINLKSAFFGTQLAAKQMIAQGGGGSIVMISSPHAFIPVPKAMPYNMAKAATDHMARTAATELTDHRIRVNIVHPGWVDTPGERKFASEEDLKVRGGKLPWGRMATPDEIARGVVFLCDPASEYITGSALLIDGGNTLPWWAKSGMAVPP